LESIYRKNFSKIFPQSDQIFEAELSYLLSLNINGADLSAIRGSIMKKFTWKPRRGLLAAEIPRHTAKEWDLLQQGLVALPPERLQKVGLEIAVLADQVSRPIVCPMLDQVHGACLVYAYRPVACRTYGFYVQRDQGLYCKDIESRVADGALTEVVWGNHDVIDHRLCDLGESRELPEWFAQWKGDND